MAHYQSDSGRNDRAAGGVALGAGAALVALLMSGKLKAAEGAQQEVQEVIQQSLDTGGLVGSIQALQAAINSLAAVTRNLPKVIGFTVLCGAANTAVRLPNRAVPHGKALVVKALPTNGGIIRIASSGPDAINPGSSYTLIANEAIEYEVTNAEVLYISATVAGEGVVCTMEQE